jgi:hypothetical protein
VQNSIHGREILAVSSHNGLLVTGSEDTTFKVHRDGIVTQTYSAHEASVKCFAHFGDLMLSAGSKM